MLENGRLKSETREAINIFEGKFKRISKQLNGK